MPQLETAEWRREDIGQHSGVQDGWQLVVNQCIVFVYAVATSFASVAAAAAATKARE